MATEQTYTLDGPTEFFFPFSVRTAGEVVVSLVPGGVLPPSEYEVIGASATATGITVRYPNAPRDGSTDLTITRVTSVDRVSIFLDDLSITATALNAEFDNFLAIIQDGIVNDYRGEWETNLLYLQLDVVLGPDGNIYVATEQHTSTTFEDDRDVENYWRLIADFAQGQQAIDTALQEAEAARDKAEQWAEEPEDSEVETGKFSALHYAAKAEDSEIAASNSEAAAQTSEDNAATSEQNAANSASAALTSEQNAATSEQNAEDSENAAANSASAALTSEQNAASSEQNASNSASAALTSEQNAASSEQNAEDSAAAALTSEQNAATSEQNAAGSEAESLRSKNAAAASETSALLAVIEAEHYADRTSADAETATQAAADAQISEDNAADSEDAAATSEQNASDSASAALSSEQNAASSEQNAATSEQNASNSASAALTSEQNAQTSEDNAAASENKAELWADQDEDTPVETNPDKFSAKHWAAKSQEFAQGAAVNISYDNSDNELNSTNVQAALDEFYQNFLVQTNAGIETAVIFGE